MAIAKKCDICGEFYEPYNIKKDPKMVNGFTMLNIDLCGQYWNHKITDCCPKCMTSIQVHIEYLKSKGQTNG